MGYSTWAVAVGSRLCNPAGSGEAEIMMIDPAGRGLRYVSRPGGAVFCRPGEVCGFYWSVQHRFSVSLPDPRSGRAILLPR